jgi:NAD+ kinase
MTSTSERSVSNIGTEKVGLATSAPSSATKVSFDSSIPSDRASNSGKYQHGVVQPSPRSLLDSPDRFGQAGPPAPPRALSERHLATADFRLDDDPDPESDLDQPVINEKTRDGIDESSQDGKPKPTSTRQTTQDRNLRDSVLHAAESKTKIASNTNKLYKKVKGRAASTTRSMKARSNADDVDGFNGGFDLGRTDSRKSGGAALVVYGQDESDSDSTAEG